MPVPSDDAEFHEPERFPFEITRPSGSPSGVKNPALMASMAWWLDATCLESKNSLPGPLAWSMTKSAWSLESNETPSKRMFESVFCESFGVEAVEGADGMETGLATGVAVAGTMPAEKVGVVG